MRTDTLLGAVVLAACVAPREPAVAALAAKDSFVEWDRSARLVGDVDGDGERDLVFVGRRPARVVIGVVKGPASVSSEAWLLELPVRGAAPGRAPVETTLSFETPATRAGDEGPTSGAGSDPGSRLRAALQAAASRGTRGILVSDGVGGTVHVYWNPVDRRLEWWRTRG